MRLQIKWIEGWAYAHGTGPDGKRIRRALRTRDPARAEEARAALEAKLWKIGLYGADHVLTFEECALAYVKDGGETRFVLAMARRLAGKRLKDITPAEIREAARLEYPNASNATLNRQGVTPARAVINFGHQQGWCPAIRVKAFPTQKPKRQAVDARYLDKLRPHLPHPLYVMMMFLHVTGRRVSDAIHLTADRVHGDRVVFETTKNGEPAVTYMTPEVAAMVAGITPEAGKVFPYAHRSSVYATLRRACAKAGVPYLGTHQPGRHSFATTLSQAGFSTKAIADAGGWKSVRLVAEVYEHPEEVGQRAAKVIGKKLAKRIPKGMKV